MEYKTTIVISKENAKAIEFFEKAKFAREKAEAKMMERTRKQREAFIKFLIEQGKIPMN